MPRPCSPHNPRWPFRTDPADPPVEPAPVVNTRGAPKMRRCFDDAETHARKLDARHATQQRVRAARKLAGLCASCGAALPDEYRRFTCEACLSTDRAYKTTVLPRTLATARYTDELGRPMPLRFAARMLPIIGPRHDGDALPACASLPDCMREIVLACGAREAPGASCPKDCASFDALDEPTHVRLAIAMIPRVDHATPID